MDNKKCKICGREIISDVLYKGDYDEINISVSRLDDGLYLDGHKICLENVNKFVVIPNRTQVEPLIFKK
jgi:hypothetical protein